MSKRKKRDRMALIPADLFDGLGVPDGARVLFEELCAHANKQSECWPSVGRLSAKLKVKPRTIQNRTKSLEQFGLVERHVGFVHEGGGLRRRHVYRVYRDKSELATVAARNCAKIEVRKAKFGEYGKRGALKSRIASGRRVKFDANRGENPCQNEVNSFSPKHNKEQNQEHSKPHRYRLMDGYDTGRLAGYVKPDTDPINIEWSRWADWLVKKMGCSIEEAHLILMRWIEMAQCELELSYEEASIVADGLLKIMRHADSHLKFEDLLEQEKRRRDGRLSGNRFAP